MKLIPMTEQIFKLDIVNAKEFELKKTCDRLMAEKFVKCVNYANFLKKPLELGMFVPCDLEGNVLEEPKMYNLPTEAASVMSKENYKSCVKEYRKYQEAKERVLLNINLEGLDGIKHHIKQGRNIECLTQFKDITLTQSAIKQIGYKQ